MLLRNRRLRDGHFFIEHFGSLIDIHLNNSRKGEEEAESESPQESLRSTLGVDLSHLFLEVLELADFSIHIQHHPCFDNPYWLCNKGR